MATSSIFAKFSTGDEKTARLIVDELDRANTSPNKERKANANIVEDKKAIEKLFARKFK